MMERRPPMPPRIMPLERPSSRLFFNDTATTEIYTLSLHDALPISIQGFMTPAVHDFRCPVSEEPFRDRKSTRLNSSHLGISYAVFCLKKEDQRGAGRQGVGGSSGAHTSGLQSLRP